MSKANEEKEEPVASGEAEAAKVTEVVNGDAPAKTEEK